MTNQELDIKIKEILKNENFFDMMEQALEFEKEYKTSSFYKKTKLSLMEVLKQSKVFYLFNLTTIFETLQEKINTLDISNFIEMLEKLGSVFGQENSEIQEMIKEIGEYSWFNQKSE